MILILDNYDSFTYNLLDYVNQHGVETLVIRNDKIQAESLEELTISGIILSPGPGRPTEAGNMMQVIAYAVEHKIPLLGICLGFQAIGEYFGAQLVKAIQPMHGKTSVISHNGDVLFTGIPKEFTVMRYHSLILKDITETILIPTAISIEGELMAFSHPNQLIYGLQFHPESIGTPEGINIISNWLSILNIKSVIPANRI